MCERLTSPPDDLIWEMSMTQEGLAGKTQHIQASNAVGFVTALEHMAKESDGVTFGLHISSINPSEFNDMATDSSDGDPAGTTNLPLPPPNSLSPPRIRLAGLKPTSKPRITLTPIGLAVEYTLYVPHGDLKRKIFAHLAKQCDPGRLDVVAIESNVLSCLA
ncbi:hypothetical protein PTTG_06499 [Puccinia triticina 1-1 BBBD Race 1]|uniref:Uncharacterized protein n=2 Tax=Puccinia triticina TaxID=208348 RepID=A0A0C4F083_PUCT1|nr:uncharacterized protein PtA15_5A890 [Puccinia triticina]OAV91639.1 hypothetical protein PTTG_06499 [Puccinia triticina 1-1 BBBD Race 1]WAQ85315.1 hypothetical protein PtA15_5A890 [Puccinia triticina]WAR58608.1 hypothetical protein PtB15_5B842 [Puccinia triticina]